MNSIHLTGFLAALCLTAASGIAIGAHLERQVPEPRLIGLGCQGTDKPIYAVHEDDFPPCEAIQEL